MASRCTRCMEVFTNVIFPFLLWMTTSFLTHKLGKEFLESSEGGQGHVDLPVTSHLNDSSLAETTWPRKCINAFALTALQVSLFVVTVTPAQPQSRCVVVLWLSTHLLATFSTNLSMAFIQAASTFALKLMEPVTMAIAQSLVFKKNISLETYISLPLVIGGAFLFSVPGSALNKASNVGTALALTSNLLFTSRNITIKKMQLTGVPPTPDPAIPDSSALSKKKTGAFHFRSRHVMLVGYSVLTVGVVVYFTLYFQRVMSEPAPYTVLMIVGSATFNVLLTYVSTNVVLKTMTVVSHSVANVFKRLMVVLLLYFDGRSSLTSGRSWAGLALAGVGLAIYVKPMLCRSAEPGNSEVGVTSTCDNKLQCLTDAESDYSYIQLSTDTLGND